MNPIDRYNFLNKVLKKDIRHSTPLRISETYLDPVTYDKVFNNKNIEKKKWKNEKGFNVAVGKYKGNFIKNYVNVSEGQRFNDFKFRDDHKEKWIDKNGFKYKHGHDLLLHQNNENVSVYQDY